MTKKRKMISAAFVLFLLYFVAVFASESGEDGSSTIVASRVVELEHSIKNGVFKPRGKFTIQMNADGQQAVVNMDKFSLTEDMADDFKELLRTGGYYKLRMRSSGDKNAPFVQTSMPACGLQKSGFKEDLSLFVSADESLTIRGTSYNSPVIGLARTCDASTLKTPAMFLSRIKMGENQKTLEVPLQATGNKPYYLGHVNIETTFVDSDGTTKVKASEQPPLPWYRKYWYILVAGYMLLRMTSSDAPDDKKKKD